MPISSIEKQHKSIHRYRKASLLQRHSDDNAATCDAVLVVVSGPPVEVGVTMYVLSISSLSEVKMVLSIYILFK